MKLGIYLPDELVLEARKHCEETGKSFSGMIRVGIKKQLKEAQE